MIGQETVTTRSNPSPHEKKIHLVQGEYHVTTDPNVVLTTILGSCVAACIRDPFGNVGGMNHFLLPGDDRGDDRDSLRYGVHSMELLLNGILRAGGRRDRLEGKLFGGARMLKGLTDVGELNAKFAENFLKREGIRIVGGSLCGDRGRRIQYWPCSGRARQINLEPEQRTVFEAELKPRIVLPDSGNVELF